jgi:hypothetical protein
MKAVHQTIAKTYGGGLNHSFSPLSLDIGYKKAIPFTAINGINKYMRLSII